MKANTRAILERCIEEALSRGYERAHKHELLPSKDAFTFAMNEELWLEIDCYFNFEDEVQ